MIVGGLAVLAGLAYFPIGQGIAYLSWPFVAYTIRAVEWFARFEGGVLVVGRVSLALVVGFYLVLFASTIWGKRIKIRLPNASLGYQLAGLAVVTSLVWQAALSAPDGRMHIVLLDVGMGDAVLIQTPEGRFVLIDGGESSTRLSDGLGRWLPLFHRQLDYLVVAAPREEQVAALPRVVDRFPPNTVLWAGPPNLSRSSRFLQETLTEMGVAMIQAEPGQTLDLGQGAELEVLTTGKRGALLLLTWQNFRLLIPSGISFEEMEGLGLGREIGRVDGLLLADEGFAPLNPPEWIANLQPGLVLLSVAAGNYDGLPSVETVELLSGYTLLRTDQNGWVHLTTDGVQMWVEVERK
jgi:competence protein ComEC